MNHTPIQIKRGFQRSFPLPCPYRSDRLEQRIFTVLDGPPVQRDFNLLTQAGFRRSANMLYRPACSGCAACVPVRVAVRAFTPSRSMRRCRKVNTNLSMQWNAARATLEQYGLFRRYLNARHQDGGMTDMSWVEFQAMVNLTPVKSAMVEWRNNSGQLIAACLTDHTKDGLSAVYSFFDPVELKRGLGNTMILWLIEEARRLNRDYLYLGYWVADSPKMAYKTRFAPLEQLTNEGWKMLKH